MTTKSSLNLSIREWVGLVLVTSVWVHISEVFRYFTVVRPEMQQYLSMVPDVADMNIRIFMIWGIWDTLVTLMLVLLYCGISRIRGHDWISVLLSGLAGWCFFFLLFWIGLANMNLARWAFLPQVLSLALIEVLVACGMIFYLLKRKQRTQ